MTDGPAIAVVRDYDDLLDAFRARFTALGASAETIETVAGLPLRYLSKLLRPVPLKNIGRVTLGPLCGVGGVKLLMVEDPEAFARVARRLTPRGPGPKAYYADDAMPTRQRRKKWAHPHKGDSAWGRRMRALAVLRQSSAQRSRLARRAARARWRKRRSEVR